MSKKNIEIEYLRALAILITILAHLPFLLPDYSDWFGKIYFSLYAPWTGVDLFFAISGYVIAKSYSDFFDEYIEKNQFGMAFLSFWIKRVYRLLPTAWLWVIIGFVLSIIFNQTGVFGTWYENLRSATAVFTFTGNLANQSGLYLGPNGVYWSLALEEQFYFLFPIFLMMFVSRKVRIYILLALVLIQFFINRDPFGSSWQGMLASFRLDAIMLGVLLYYLTQSKSYKHLDPGWVLSSRPKAIFVTGLLVYLLGAVPGQMINMPIVVGMVAVISVALVFLASYQQGYIPSVPIISPILAWVGARSYGLYLIHVPVYRFTYELSERLKGDVSPLPEMLQILMLVCFALLLMFSLAEINYRCIEAPLRRVGARIAANKLQVTSDSNKQTVS